MEIVYPFQGITFTWERSKARRNLRKHGVLFELACEVFFDPFMHLVEERDVNGESREAVIGLTAGWDLLHVAFVLRGQAIRLISARRVTRSERKRYEDG